MGALNIRPAALAGLGKHSDLLPLGGSANPVELTVLRQPLHNPSKTKRP